MEEEVGIKVTRLRRRLSVEADDVKSPSTQSTPTKKRGGRLAAKPQLELIDENASEAAPKKSRKSTVKEAEPVEEKAVTPSRRSTRIRSNTSIVSETPDLAEEKGTPSRRSTRIKSNTSLITEPVNVNSPRAKRAARRTSLVGSDNEAPITPARQTRRTRNNSTSSIDKPVEMTAGKLGGEIKEVIVEESENNVKETYSTERSQNDSPSLRKSPRLVGKSGRKSSSLDNDNKENEPRIDKEASETTAVADKSLSEPKPTAIEVEDNKAPEQINLSVTSKNLIQEIEEAPKKGKSIFNKSTPSVEEPQIKAKRNRTKSWTTISVESPQESSFCSDSEAAKKRNKDKNATLNFSKISGSGDGIMNTSNKNDEADKDQDNVSLNSSITSNKKKKKRHEMSMTEETETPVNDVSVFNTSVNKSATKLSEAKDFSKDNNEELNSSKKHKTSFTQKIFEKAPTGIVESLVFIEDSDSNNEVIGKENNDKTFDSGDQCVPVVDQSSVENEPSKDPQNNLSYEPMDIDETMPENLSLSNFIDKNDSAVEKRKSILNFSQVKNDSFNKSTSKSGILFSEDNVNEASIKSPKKSSISEIVMNDAEENNKSRRMSSINNDVSKDTTDGVFNMSNQKSLDNGKLNESLNKKAYKSNQKSSISNIVTEQDKDRQDEDSNISTRKTSISNIINEQNIDEDSNKSTRKSLNADMNNHDEDINKKANKSKRKSSISNIVTEQNTNEDSNNFARKSLNAEKSFDKSLNKEANKSKIKSLSNIVSDEITNDISNKYTRKSSITELASDDNMDKSLNKSKKKSLTAMAVKVTMDNIKTSILDDNDDKVNKSSNKSKRKSSISNMPNNDSIEKNSDNSKNKSALSLDKTENNENKSTLVLSQLKDVSESEINAESTVAKDSNDLNEQLSKSVNLPNDITEKDTDKKNLSLTYSTSTPLQQKSLKKLGLQINTSIIAPNSANKVEKKNTSKSKKETSIMSEEDGSNSSGEEDDDSEEEDEDSEEEDEEDIEEESSMKGSKMIDDEAEEASDDYESGDSRGDDEREYEEQNEIRDKGETLDSDEEELSDDSDYEKDSFIVSSDAEDQDLLSGSGDDLSMSADELTMTAKSKKKFNERKVKEQKKASREMYEARHKLNESPKSKKNNRQRFDTSSSESEEVDAQPKKTRRLRIDSSHEASASQQSDTDKSMFKKRKNKAKRLSESVCDDDETNEKEVTILDENQTDKDDPLTLLNVIKEEPKTPQKGLNISTVAITNMDEVEEVNVDENVSILKSNQTSDPLQATIAENDEEDNTDEGSVSENEEITQNFESVLYHLNKSGSKKIKTSNISLDLDKKIKKKTNEPVVDQLNLTQVKKSKKKKGDVADNAAESKKQDKSLTSELHKSVNKVAKQDISEGSSDSIDMKLLFTEDSNDSDAVKEKKETQKEDVEEFPEDFIPLKRSQGKTNIHENMDMANTLKNESILNVSGKKKNKRKSFQSQDTEIGAPEVENLGYFIDTTGSLANNNKFDANTLMQSSAIKNKQNNKNVSFTGKEEILVDEDSNDAPLEISYRSEKNLNTTQNNDATKEGNVAVGTPNQSAKKKKNKKGHNSTQNAADFNVMETTDDVPVKFVNFPVTNLEGSAKKNKKKSETQAGLETETATPPKPILNVSLGSAKKQKQKRISESAATETPVEPILNVSLGSAKKQKHKTISESATIETPAKPTLNVSLGSAKKQNQKTISESATIETPAKPILNVSLGSAKKQKQKTISESAATGSSAEPILNVSLGSAKKQKQKTISESAAVETENLNKAEYEDVANQELVTKKRKRKSSGNQTIDDKIIKDDVKPTNDGSLMTKNQKKKRKISNNDGDNKPQVEDLVAEEQVPENPPVENSKKKTKAQQQKVDEISDGATKKNKKRKERDDDDASKISKVLKQNSFDKVHIPRLPSNVLIQLDDKPKKDSVEVKKVKVVSTSEFAVEETKRRRNKPSNYLEESVYCINDDMVEKKQKRSIKNPKVLPFIPTASTSDSGFTTKFRVNVIPDQTQFVAQTSDVSNFKNDYLHKKRIKKLGTFEMYKRQRNIKIAKF